MTIRLDPEGNETHALFSLTQLDGRDILEVGCGDGRLTWRLAEKAAHVDAIDGYEESIIQAKASIPANLSARLHFYHAPFEQFASSRESATYDAIVLSWSLC